MAYAALVSLSQTIDQILNHHQYTISHHQNQQIVSLHKYVILLQAFLEDFPKKANSLEVRIREVANEAEDIIEYFMWDQKRMMMYLANEARSSRSIVGRAIFEYTPRCYDFRLKKATEKIESIAWEVMDIKNSFRIKDMRLDDPPAASSSSRIAPAGKNDMVGFNVDLMAIKARLCGESSKLQVIPIVGMGGIGKTTLAKNAYDDPLTIQHFDVRAWVTVSQEYSSQEILSGLLDSMKVLNTERFGQNDQLMAANVHKTLKARRYLIVMDDMWSTKAWDDVRMIFPDDGNGSRIMLTSRLSDVAAYADPSSPLYEMHFMNVDQSWNLLKQKVFTQEDCPRELENIGKKIATSCGGLPLAIVVTAGLLSTVNETRASWEEIAGNVTSAVASKDGQFEKILSLSYSHLPHHLRPCFLYMGGFPEDYEIHVSKLIKLWLAEGFLKRPNGSKSFEEGAEEYVEDLVKRSLVLVTKRKSNGKIKSCRVHDLVRDLCIRKAEQEKFLVHPMDKSSARKVSLKSIKNQRRISIAHSDLNCLVNIHGSTIHTITCFYCRASSLGSLVNFRLLRVLDMVNSHVSSLHSFTTEEFDSLPAQVFELFHLRYLAFDYPIYIPAAISNLQNLQTLIIHPRKSWVTIVPSFLYLSSEILRLPQLRHLACFSIDPFSIPKEAIFSLPDLQTLSIATHFTSTFAIVEIIPNLKKLSISHYEDRYGGHVDFRYENRYGGPFDYLVHLHTLENLKLHIYAGSNYRRMLIHAFPPMLKKLTLIGCRLPMTIVGSLPNLQVLKVRDSAFDGGKWETTEGEFPQLKFLLIEKSNLKHWITESSHFPLLKCLLLHRCRHLSKIPDVIGEIPTLELIEVENGNTSLVESAKQIQEEQQSWGNYVLQVRCMHY